MTTPAPNDMALQSAPSMIAYPGAHLPWEWPQLHHKKPFRQLQLKQCLNRQLPLCSKPRLAPGSLRKRENVLQVKRRARAGAAECGLSYEQWQFVAALQGEQ